jgi:hypothetical protein
MTLYNRFHIEWPNGHVETFETSGERSARSGNLEDMGYTFGEDFIISTSFEIED